MRRFLTTTNSQTTVATFVDGAGAERGAELRSSAEYAESAEFTAAAHLGAGAGLVELSASLERFCRELAVCCAEQQPKQVKGSQQG